MRSNPVRSAAEMSRLAPGPALRAVGALVLVALAASQAMGAAGPRRGRAHPGGMVRRPEVVRVRDEGRYMLVRYTTDGTELERFSGFGTVTGLASFDSHTVLVAEQDRGSIAAFDLEGRISWEIPVRQPRCVQSLGGGLFLVCMDNPATVAEVDGAGKISWEIKEPLVDASGAARLADGNTAIVEGRSNHHAVHIVDRAGKFLWSATDKLAQPLGVSVLPSGELVTSGFDSGLLVIFKPYEGLSRLIQFCCHAQAPTTGPDGTIVAASPERQVVQAWNADGAALWAFSTFYPPYAALPLPDGSVLVAVYRIPDRTCFDRARAAKVAAQPLPDYLRSLGAGVAGGLLLTLLLQWPVLRRRVSAPRRRRSTNGTAERAPPAPPPGAIRRFESGAYVLAAAALLYYAARVHDDLLARSLAQVWPYAGFVAAAGVFLALLQQRSPYPDAWLARMRSLPPAARPTWRAALCWGLGASLIGAAFEGVFHSRGVWVAGIWSAGLTLLAGGTIQDVEEGGGWNGAGKRWTSLVLTVAAATLGVALLLFVNVYRLEDVPPNLHHDMAQWTLQALRLLDGNIPTLFTNGWAQIPMTGYLWSALVAACGDRSLAAVRLASALGGVIAIVAAFFLVRRLYGLVPALLAAALLGMDHVFVHFSRIQSYMDPVPFHVLAVLGLFAGMESGRYGWFALAGLAGGYSALSYHAGRITPLAMALLVGVLLVRYPRALLRRWSGLLLAVVSILAVVGVQGIIYASGRADTYGRVDQFAWVGPNGIDYALLQRTIELALPRVFGSFWFFHDASTQYGGSVIFFPPVAALLGAFIVAALLRFWDVRGVFLVLWGALVLFVGGVLTRDPPFWPRLVIALVPATIAAGIAAAHLCRGAVAAAGRIGAAVALAGALALLLFDGRFQLETYREYVEGRAEGATRPGRSTQWVQSLMGRDAQSWGPDAMIYIVAPNPIVHSCTHPTMEYYVYGLDSQDARDIRDYLPFDRKRTTVAYFLPEMADSIVAVKRAHPDAEIKYFYDNLDQHVFTRVVVAKR
jgi:Dolichyl-phosphate-mannose-protein mannosyltransferase